MKRTMVAAMVGLTACLVASSAMASNWPHDSRENLRISSPGTTAEYPVIAADGAGGAVIVWTNDEDEMWAQRIDMHGNPVWPVPGVKIVEQPGSRIARAICADLTGGVVVSWQDARNNPPAYDIYAQRLSPEGTPMWIGDGVRVCVNDSSQGEPYIEPDGEGGAFFVFVDGRNGASDYDIMAQHLDAAGNRLWNDDGVGVCAAYGVQINPDIARASDGMIVVVWEDYRFDSWSDTYVQKLSPDGEQVWINNGVAAANTMSVAETQGCVAPDEFGGAIVAWRDTRAAWTIYGQRFDDAGNAMWTAGGVKLVNDTGLPGFPEMVPDGNGGATLAFWDDRSGSIDIAAQRVDQAGSLPWGPDGVLMTQAPGAQTDQEIVADGTGGIVAVWYDQRGGAADIYAQRVNGDGDVMWEAYGVPVCTDPTAQSPSGACSDGLGGVIAIWEDPREFPILGIYAQRVDRNGYLGYPSPDMTSVSDAPGDQGGSVIASWAASWLDAYPYAEVTHYSVWRWTPMLASPAKSSLARARADGIDGGVVEREAFMGWEYVGTVPAAYQVEYAMTVPSFGDSTIDGGPETFVKVIAHTADPWTLWESLPGLGYSRDNLAPAGPLALSATRVGNFVRLEWTPGGVPEPDFAYYAVYRATTSGVTPEPIHFLDASETDTFWDQDAAPGSPWFYIVTAVDIHHNNSEPSNEAGVDGSVTGVGDRTPVITRLTVLPNVPNPFDRATELGIGLPRAGAVTIGVYDVAGRRVMERTVALADGWQWVTLDGGPLPSGVYFCRVHFGRETVTRKLVVRR